MAEMKSSASNEHKITVHREEENENDCCEYKYRLTNVSQVRLETLATQMQRRMNQGNGQAVYHIGVTDCGFAVGLSDEDMEESLANLEKIATMAQAKICGNIEREKIIHYAKSRGDIEKMYVTCGREQENPEADGNADADSSGSPTRVNQRQQREAKIKRHQDNITTSPKDGSVNRYEFSVAEVLVRRIQQVVPRIKIGIVGDVDAGKSTLTGVLSNGISDDGRGSARSSVVTHRHELTSGRTSSVGQHIVGYDVSGEHVNQKLAQAKHRVTWADVVTASDGRIITLFDLAGHQKYLPVTLRGISANYPDWSAVIVSANMVRPSVASSRAGTGSGSGEKYISMTEEHISICMAFRVPFFVIITKVDMVPPDVLRDTVSHINSMIKTRTRKRPFEIRSMNDVSIACNEISGRFIVPVMKISSVTMEGFDMLHRFMNLLPIRRNYVKARKKQTFMQIQESFQKTGVGLILAGNLRRGVIKINDKLKIGPMKDHTFREVKVRSLHMTRVPCDRVEAGNYLCANVTGITRDELRRGMFMVSIGSEPTPVWEYVADIQINDGNPGSIRIGYQPHCHIGHIRQNCQITEIVDVKIGARTKKYMALKGFENVNAIGPGDTARVKLRFCFRPEILVLEGPPLRFVFRENRTRGTGIITEVTDAVYEPINKKRAPRTRGKGK